MPTLITAFDKEGNTIGRCDARCYNGVPGRCFCICGGINHGVGLHQAAKQTLRPTSQQATTIATAADPRVVSIRLSTSLSGWAHPQLPFPEGFEP